MKPQSLAQRLIAWSFVAPALAVIGLFFLLPVVIGLALSFSDFDLYALADWRNLRRCRQLCACADAAAVLAGALQHAVLRGLRRAAVDRAVAGLRGAAAVAAGALQAVLPHGTVCAGGHHAGGGGHHLALPAAHALRYGQRRAGP